MNSPKTGPFCVCTICIVDAYSRNDGKVLVPILHYSTSLAYGFYFVSFDLCATIDFSPFTMRYVWVLFTLTWLINDGDSCTSACCSTVSLSTALQVSALRDPSQQTRHRQV